jgi:hypothetical protein
VPVNTSIVLFLNKVLNGSTVPGALHVSANGQLVSGTATATGNNGQTVQFTPAAALPYGALIQVFLDTAALDTSGNTVTSYQASFMAFRAARLFGLRIEEMLSVEETYDYDAATQIGRGRWYISAQKKRDAWILDLDLRNTFPQELPLLLAAGGATQH